MDEALAATLLELHARLRRGLRARLRRESGGRLPPQAQVELILQVAREPGRPLRHAAAALRLQPNTVSTLVRDLARAGLVERSPGEDRRAVLLHLTAEGEARLESWRAARRAIMVASLRALPVAERERLRASAAGLARLVEEVEGT
jgi:DNA-binding MarR family transcriptional regulator